MIQENPNDTNIGLAKERLNIFTMLSKMLDANKIRFIDIEDSFDKDEIL